MFAKQTTLLYIFSLWRLRCQPNWFYWFKSRHFYVNVYNSGKF